MERIEDFASPMPINGMGLEMTGSLSKRFRNCLVVTYVRGPKSLLVFLENGKNAGADGKLAITFHLDVGPREEPKKIPYWPDAWDFP